MWRMQHSVLYHLIAVDLETGREQPLGVTDGYEIWMEVSAGGDQAVILGTWEDVVPGESVVVGDIDDLVALGYDRWVFEAAESGWEGFTPQNRCSDTDPPAPRPQVETAMMSPDGSRLALYEMHPTCDGVGGGSSVVVLDVASGLELHRVEGGLVDFDGENLLISVWDQRLQAGWLALVDQDGTVIDLPLPDGSYRFWIDETPDLSAISLRHDGLGIVSFGDPVDDVVATLTDLLDQPSYDQALESPFEVPADGWYGGDRGPDACHFASSGYVCFAYIRFMSWNDVGLWVTFSDLTVNREAEPGDDDFVVEVPSSLQGYNYLGGDADPLAYTTHGITIGSTVAQLQALGDIVTFWANDCPEVVAFTITDAASTANGALRGSLETAWDEWEAFQESGSLNPGATVRSFEAGAQRSC